MGLDLIRRDFRVGQGGFSAIKILYRGRKVFSVVYDCGSVTSRKKFCETDIFNEFKLFNEDCVVNLVIFSHLDLDHVNMGGRLMTDYKVKNVALPYLSHELVWCFLESVRGGNYEVAAKEFCDRFYLGETVSSGGARIFYNIGGELSHGETDRRVGESDSEEEDGLEVEYRYRSVVAPGANDMISILDDVIFKPKGMPSRIELLLMLFQPHYHDIDAEAFKVKAAKYFPVDSKSYNDFKPKILKKFYYNNIHKDLNKTSIGLFISLVVRGKEYCYEQHVYTGDMTIDKYAIDFLASKVGSIPFHKKHRLYFSCKRNIHFQLPHHGSRSSIDLRSSVCRWILKYLTVYVMHGKNRKHHPSPEVMKKVTNLCRVLESGKKCSKTSKRAC